MGSTVHKPNVSRYSETLIKDLMDSTSLATDYGDSYPNPSGNTCYVSEFGRFAAIFAALNINILSIAYEPTSSPRRIYTTDLPSDSSSYTFAEGWAAPAIHDASDATVERSTLDSAPQHVTFLVEFKARVTSSDYATQSKWVKFPVTVSVDELADAPDYVYGQIIDQALQARELLQTPALWPSLTALERGE